MQSSSSSSSSSSASRSSAAPVNPNDPAEKEAFNDFLAYFLVQKTEWAIKDSYKTANNINGYLNEFFVWWKYPEYDSNDDARGKARERVKPFSNIPLEQQIKLDALLERVKLIRRLQADPPTAYSTLTEEKQLEYLAFWRAAKQIIEYVAGQNLAINWNNYFGPHYSDPIATILQDKNGQSVITAVLATIDPRLHDTIGQLSLLQFIEYLKFNSDQNGKGFDQAALVWSMKQQQIQQAMHTMHQQQRKAVSIASSASPMFALNFTQQATIVSSIIAFLWIGNTAWQWFKSFDVGEAEEA